MLQLKDIYCLPANTLNLSDWVLREDWFPELSNVLPSLGSAEFDEMENENRLHVRQLINNSTDGGYRVALMHTVWFDDQPVFIVQNEGRSGRDHVKRWVTNNEKYGALLAYIISKAAVPSGNYDLISPDAWVYEEDVFHLYGQDFAEQFGYKTEPKTPGYMLLNDPERIVPGADPSKVLAGVSKDVPQAHPYIRRGGFVMRLERDISKEELDSNPLLMGSLEGTEYNRYVWYVPAPRPENEPVISV